MAKDAYTFTVSPQLKQALIETRDAMRGIVTRCAQSLKGTDWDAYIKRVCADSVDVSAEDFVARHRLEFDMESTLSAAHALYDLNLLIEADFTQNSASCINPAAILNNIISHHSQKLRGTAMERLVVNHQYELEELQRKFDTDMGFRQSL